MGFTDTIVEQRWSLNPEKGCVCRSADKELGVMGEQWLLVVGREGGNVEKGIGFLDAF